MTGWTMFDIQAELPRLRAYERAASYRVDLSLCAGGRARRADRRPSRGRIGGLLA